MGQAYNYTVIKEKLGGGGWGGEKMERGSKCLSLLL